MRKIASWIRQHQVLASILVSFLIIWVLVGCTQGRTTPVTPTAIPTIAQAAAQDKQSEYQEIFEIVWKTVNETYFDPDFNGVDWSAIYDQYLPKVIAAVDDETFYILINAMCFELGVSHLGVIPPDSNGLEPVLSAPGSVGIDLRLIDEKAVITSVEPDSPADKAGLRTGYIILNVDGVSVDDREELVEFDVPPFNERRKRGALVTSIRTKFYGEPGQSISITYLDQEDQNHDVRLVIEERTGHPFKGEGLPPMYVGFEARYLDGGIAYIRFDGFLPPILEDVLNAIKDMSDAPAMIIDIRGNPGGFYPVRKAIASQFFPERTLLWRYATRPGLEMPGFEREAYTDPTAEAYLGPVVVLVDVLSRSSSEEFSGAMSANQRATIIGVRTSGSDLVADIQTLPNGATFIYPIAQTQTADGTVLEDRGVIPDIETLLEREALLLGIDSQLKAAIQYLLDL